MVTETTTIFLFDVVAETDVSLLLWLHYCTGTDCYVYVLWHSSCDQTNVNTAFFITTTPRPFKMLLLRLRLFILYVCCDYYCCGHWLRPTVTIPCCGGCWELTDVIFVDYFLYYVCWDYYCCGPWGRQIRTISCYGGCWWLSTVDFWRLMRLLRFYLPTSWRVRMTVLVGCFSRS